jgi:hypothetical protein
VPAWQVQGPEFKLQYHQKKKKAYYSKKKKKKYHWGLDMVTHVFNPSHTER